MTPDTARELLAELARRKAAPTPASVLARCFDKQLAFIRDKSRLKAALTSRRAGKSFAVGAYLLAEAMAMPGCTCLYLGLTRESARRILVKDVLDVLNAELGIGYAEDRTRLSYTLPNGSVIYVSGADASDKEREKLLGQKYKAVVVDESASWRSDIRELIYKHLRPATADQRGTICLVGTPGNGKGFFYEVTTGQVPGWSLHHWMTSDNPHMAVQWAEELAELVAANPRVVETPAYQQMYLGKWATDVDALVYRFAERNVIARLPDAEEWNYVLGVDLGYNDPTAFVVLGYRDNDPTTYVVESSSESKLIVSAVAERIRVLSKRYSFVRMVVDGASKQTVEELKQRFSLPLHAAEKQHKAETIEIMNSGFILGEIAVVDGPATATLRDEWNGLIWDERAAKKTEHPACPNHCADACLYGWRASKAYTEKHKTVRAKQTPEQEVEAFWRAEEARMLKDESEELTSWERELTT